MLDTNNTDQGRFAIRMVAVVISFLAALLVTVELIHADNAFSEATPHDFSCMEVTQIPQAECVAIVAFYNSTDGPHWWRREGWLQSNTPCTWFGLACTKGHITQIVMENNWLRGHLPPELGNLTNLLRLKLSGNELYDQIPVELGHLTNLQSMELGGNRLNGILPPELGDLTGLHVLDLSSNHITGNIPATLGNLTNLNRVMLSVNHLSGPIPPELGNLVNLQELQLSENELSGPLPPTLGNLPLLEVLAIELCFLSGELPPELGNLHNLGSLLLYRNQLQGAIPATFGNLTNLEYLSLGTNHLSGPISPELGKLTQVQYLDLSSNHLSGSIPPELGNMSSLLGLELSDNQLSGEIPAELMQPPYLYSVGVDYNMVTPTDPTVIAWLNMVDPGWEYTQTVPPSNVQATLVASHSATLTWTPIPHLWWEEGFYEVSYATRPGGPYVVHGTTPDRATDHYGAADLPPANLYCFVVRTFTARPIYYFANEWWSAYSPEVCVGAPTAVHLRSFSATATLWGRPLCTPGRWPLCRALPVR